MMIFYAVTGSSSGLLLLNILSLLEAVEAAEAEAVDDDEEAVEEEEEVTEAEVVVVASCCCALALGWLKIGKKLQNWNISKFLARFWINKKKKLGKLQKKNSFFSH